jgi:hypothetical protein
LEVYNLLVIWPYLLRMWMDLKTRMTYVAPAITTLSEEQILEELGPAKAYTGNLPFSF